MGLETGTYISDLVSTNPASGDSKSQGDDHLRLIKAALLATFPNISGEVTPTHTQINGVAEDYAATTFTPVIQGMTTNGTGTYTTQHGDYTVIGDRCFFNITLVWTAHTGTGNMKVEGLPFTSKSGNGGWPVTAYSFGLSLTASSVLQALIPANATRISIGTYPAGGGSLSDIPMDTVGTLYLSGHYVIA